MTSPLVRAVLGSVLLLNSCALLSQPDGPRLASPELDELSGLAASRAAPELLWGHNDSGDGPVLYRIGTAGEDLGSTRIDGISTVDWEDIAAFDWNGRPVLLIGDIGDNNARRDVVSLHAVSDPGVSGDAKLLWTLKFRYADGPRDCEALAVDESEGSILLLSKRDVPQRLYRLPLPRGTPPARSANDVATAELLGTVTTIPGASVGDLVANPGYGQYSGQPTALDIARDGRSAIVITYKQAYRYRRAPGQTWIDAFAGTPETIAIPRLRQTEAGAIAADGKSLFVSSEGLGAPLLRVPLPALPSGLPSVLPAD